MTVLAWGTTCPWCGRPVTGTQAGTLRTYKSNTRGLLGSRVQCRGGGKDPNSLTEEQRAALRPKWRDEEGGRR